MEQKQQEMKDASEEPKPQIVAGDAQPASSSWNNEKSLGRHIGNKINPADKTTEETKKITPLHRVREFEKDQNKLWTEKTNPEKAGKDDKIQKVKEEKEKEQPQHKAAEAEKKQAQAKKEERAQKRKAKAKELESKACCRKLKKICRKVKGKVKAIKARIADKAAERKDQQPKQSLLKSFLEREAGGSRDKEVNKQKEQQKGNTKDTGNKGFMSRLLERDAGSKSSAPTKTPTKSSPIKTK